MKILTGPGALNKFSVFAQRFDSQESWLVAKLAKA